MSFMAGFGQGFSDTFSRGIEAKNRRRDDIFKMTFNEFKEQRESITKSQQREREAIKKAKSLVEMAGAPEGAWVNAFDWIMADVDDKTIMESLQKGQFGDGGTPQSERPAGVVDKRLEDQTNAAMAPSQASDPSKVAAPTQPVERSPLPTDLTPSSAPANIDSAAVPGVDPQDAIPEEPASAQVNQAHPQQVSPMGATPMEPMATAADTAPFDPLASFERAMKNGPAVPATRTPVPEGAMSPAPMGAPSQPSDPSENSEDMVTIGTDEGFVNIPTIVNGKRVSKDQAYELYVAGVNPAVGKFATQEEAIAAAQARSNQTGQVQGAEAREARPQAPVGPVGGAPEGPAPRRERDSFLGMKLTTTESMTDDAINQISQMSGIPPEQVRQIYQGNYQVQSPLDGAQRMRFTPPKPDVKAPSLAEANYMAEFGEDEQTRLEGQRWRQSIMESEAIKQAYRGRADAMAQGGNSIIVKNKDGKLEWKNVIIQPDGTMQDWLGNPVQGTPVAPVDKAAAEWIKKHVDFAESKPVIEVKNKQNSIAGMYRTAGTMSDIVHKYGESLSTYTSEALSGAQTVLQNIYTGIDLVKHYNGRYSNVVQDVNSRLDNIVESKSNLSADQLMTAEEVTVMRSMEERLKATLGERPNDVATAYALLQTQRALFAYDLAKAYGQEGRALAEAERKMFTELSARGITPERFDQNMGIILGMVETSVSREADEIRNHAPSMQMLKGILGGEDPNNLVEIVRPTDQFIQDASKTDPQLESGYRKFQDVRKSSNFYGEDTPSFVPPASADSAGASKPAEGPKKPQSVPKISPEAWARKRVAGRTPDGRTIYDVPGIGKVVE